MSNQTQGKGHAIPKIFNFLFLLANLIGLLVCSNGDDGMILICGVFKDCKLRRFDFIDLFNILASVFK